MALTIRGVGSVEIAAYGIADAEATVEKELKAIFPESLVQIREVRRTNPTPRIVETFEVAFSVRVQMDIGPAEEGIDKARRRAFAAGRRALMGTRYEKIEWGNA